MFLQDIVSALGTPLPYAQHSNNLTHAGATCRYEECRQFARLRTIDAQSSAKMRYNEHHRQVTYAQGDVVRLWVPVRKQRLSETLFQYVNLYRVLRPLPPVTFSVEPANPPSVRIHRSTESAHVSHLKPYVSRTLTST